MSYQAKTDWKYDETVTENDLNRIEQGIKEAHEKSTENEQDLATHSAEDASLVKKGHVQLSNATDSASESLAATPKAIKEVMDKAQEAFTLGNSRKKELVDLLLSLDDSLPLNHSSSWDDIFSVAGSTSTGKKWATGEASTVGVNPRRVLVSGLSFKPSYILSIRANSKFNIAAFGDMVSLGASYDLGVQVDNYPRVGYVLATLNEDGFSLPVSDDSGSWVWIALE